MPNDKKANPRDNYKGPSLKAEYLNAPAQKLVEIDLSSADVDLSEHPPRRLMALIAGVAVVLMVGEDDDDTKQVTIPLVLGLNDISVRKVFASGTAAGLTGAGKLWAVY